MTDADEPTPSNITLDNEPEYRCQQCGCRQDDDDSDLCWECIDAAEAMALHYRCN